MSDIDYHAIAEKLRGRFSPPAAAMRPAEYYTNEVMHALADAMDEVGQDLTEAAPSPDLCPECARHMLTGEQGMPHSHWVDFTAWVAAGKPDIDAAYLAGLPRSRVKAANELAIFSSYLDGQVMARLNGMTEVDLRAELLLMHRTIKVVEEVGEVVGALIGMTGANPRKGVTHTVADLVKELHDVAVAVEGTVEHVDGNEGTALSGLDRKVGVVFERAGLGKAVD